MLDPSTAHWRAVHCCRALGHAAWEAVTGWDVRIIISGESRLQGLGCFPTLWLGLTPYACSANNSNAVEYKQTWCEEVHDLSIRMLVVLHRHQRSNTDQLAMPCADFMFGIILPDVIVVASIR
jgi:hypothetical protein